MAALGASVLLLLIAITVGSLVATILINRARLAAISEQIRADRNATLAKAAEKQATERAVVANQQRLVALETIGSLVKEIQEHLGRAPGTLRVRQRLAEEAMARLQQIASDKSGDADVALTRIIAKEHMGDLAFLSGRTEEARQNFQAARDESEAMLRARRGDSLEVRKQLALALDKLGDLARFAADVPTAQAAFSRARQVRMEMPEAYRRSPHGLRELVVSANKIGEAQLLGKNPRAARESYLHGLELTRQVPPTDFKQHQSDLRFVLGRLGDTEVALFHYGAAVSRYREALVEVEKRVAADPDDPTGRNEHAFVMQKLGSRLGTAVQVRGGG